MPVLTRGEAMLAQMTTPCRRCGLRGPHACVTLEDYVAARPGDGPTMPEPMGGNLRKEYAVGSESIYNAAARVGMDVQDFKALLVSAGLRAPMRVSQWKVKREAVDRIVSEARGRRAA